MLDADVRLDNALHRIEVQRVGDDKGETLSIHRKLEHRIPTHLSAFVHVRHAALQVRDMRRVGRVPLVIAWLTAAVLRTPSSVGSTSPQYSSAICFPP